MSTNAVAISVNSLAGIFRASRTRTNSSAAARTMSRTTTTGDDSSDWAIRDSSLPEGRLAKRALERQLDALARELALAAQEADDAIEVGARLFDIERAGHFGLEEDPPALADPLEASARPLNLRGHSLD